MATVHIATSPAAFVWVCGCGHRIYFRKSTWPHFPQAEADLHRDLEHDGKLIAPGGYLPGLVYCIKADPGWVPSKPWYERMPWDAWMDRGDIVRIF